MKRILYCFLILTFFISGCAHTRKREAVDQLQGVWVTDWALTEPLMEDAIKAAVTRNPRINEQNLRETLTEFHKNQKFVFSGNVISPGQDKWGTYMIVRVEQDGVVIREFYEGFEEYTETNPQKLLEEFSRPTMDENGFTLTTWFSDVPLITGIKFLENNRIRIFKLEADKGRLTGSRNYEHSIMKKVESDNREPNAQQSD